MISADRPRIPPLLALLLAAVGLVAGCGRSSPAASTSGATIPGTFPAHSSSPPAHADATALVRRYYRAVNSRDFRAAWRLLTPTLRHRLGGFASWEARYRFVDQVAVSDARERRAGQHAATVELSVETTGFDACHDAIEGSFAARWKVARRHGRLLATGMHLERVGGSQPIRGPAACPGPPSTPSVPPTTPSSEPKGPPAGGPARCPPGSRGCLGGPAG